MPVSISKPTMNLREELSSLKKPSGLVGEQLLRANTIDDAYSVLGNNKNFIVNGSLSVWQRGTSFAYNTLGGAPFTADRFWYYNGSGATTGAVERSTDVPANQPFAYSFFNNTNSQNPIGTNVELLRQGYPAPFIVGETYTLSFWIKGNTNGSGTFRITWRNAHATGTNEVVIKNAIPYEWTTGWRRFSHTFTITNYPDAANLVLDIEWGGFGAGVKMTGVQLERGAVATPFEVRSFHQEFEMCQRYFQKMGYDHRDITSFGGARKVFALPMPVVMRASPSVTITGSNGSPSLNDGHGYVNDRMFAPHFTNALNNIGGWAVNCAVYADLSAEL